MCVLGSKLEMTACTANESRLPNGTKKLIHRFQQHLPLPHMQATSVVLCPAGSVCSWERQVLTLAVKLGPMQMIFVYNMATRSGAVSIMRSPAHDSGHLSTGCILFWKVLLLMRRCFIDG